MWNFMRQPAVFLFKEAIVVNSIKIISGKKINYAQHLTPVVVLPLLPSFRCCNLCFSNITTAQFRYIFVIISDGIFKALFNWHLCQSFCYCWKMSAKVHQPIHYNLQGPFPYSDYFCKYKKMGKRNGKPVKIV